MTMISNVNFFFDYYALNEIFKMIVEIYNENKNELLIKKIAFELFLFLFVLQYDLYIFIYFVVAQKQRDND